MASRSTTAAITANTAHIRCGISRYSKAPTSKKHKNIGAKPITICSADCLEQNSEQQLLIKNRFNANAVYAMG